MNKCQYCQSDTDTAELDLCVRCGDIFYMSINCGNGGIIRRYDLALFTDAFGASHRFPRWAFVIDISYEVL